ncbi:protein kinase domain-containing protein, partial [Halalkalibacter lacteus]|uniref:protein kinase domain-containing protein n=1 Tax=Halalkalibacter lacteus TaxID=3090663 RepID=UPI002FC95290
GTPHYIAPERLDERPYDGRSDVYSLGVVLYQKLSGTLPFDGANIAHLFYKVLNSAPPPLREANPDVPEALEALILRTLAKA